jgi:CheY-like chemotaxis protein
VATKRILIVDDDPDIRQGMHVRLKANGYDTYFAADALACITEARKSSPDLILLDLGLPAGDGFVVMERLRLNPALAVIPVIVVSARDVRANQERALKAGAKRFCRNPWITSNCLRKSAKLSASLRSRRRPMCMYCDS